MSTLSSIDSWPLPTWIAHRGGGTLAPENTLAAFEMGWAHGFRAFECDTKLSHDGVLYLLHDDTLDRTTDHHGQSHACTWAQLQTLDAGGWHSPRFQGEHLATLQTVLDWCGARGAALNIEIKPNPGCEKATGRATALAAWAHPMAQTGPLVLSSFSPDALAAAQTAAPELRRMLLVEHLDDSVWPLALALGCVGVAAEHSAWTPQALAQCQSRGWASAAYTVNDSATAQRLLAWGVTSVFTDALDRLGPGAPTTTPVWPG